jgi:hypothetical protein
MNNTVATQSVFLTLVRSAREVPRARLLIDSIRSFGGDWRDCPIWLFETLSPLGHSPAAQSSWASLESADIKVVPLNVPDALRRYEFGDKVYACAQAEAMAANVQSLIWADPGVLFIQPPRLFDLGASLDAAVRPVHIRNVGLLATDPLDGYWQKVYQTVGVQDVSVTVDSFVDAQHLRAYFNTHAFAVNPSAGLLRQWLECFEVLVGDQAYQSACCQDERHQVFLHQAVLSALIAARLDSQRVRILPPVYNYPYNLHQSVPRDWRAQALNDLECIAYEDRPLDPATMNDIAVHDPLRSWLTARASSDLA